MTGIKIAIMAAGMSLIVPAVARAVLTQSAPDLWSEGTGRWLQGYARSISGEAISYHSAQPDINSALLVRAKRFGLEMSQPLIAAPADPGRSVADSLFEVRPDAVIVSSVRPSKDGKALMIRLYNASDSVQSAALVWRSYQASRTGLSSPFEEKGPPVSGAIELPPFGLVTLRAEK
jgi:hypothetical protein